jgi:hypothetical protein
VIVPNKSICPLHLKYLGLMIYTGKFMELLIGQQDRVHKNPKSGWNKSPTKALYHDYADMISCAMNSHEDGQNDQFVNLAMLHTAIVLGLEKRGRSVSDSAIIWFSQIGRMTRGMGKAKSFGITDTGRSTSPEVAIVAPTSNLYNGYHYSTEVMSRLHGRVKNPREQFGRQIFVKSEDRGTPDECNGLGIFCLRLTMIELELHLRKGNKTNEFKNPPCLRIPCFENGRNFTVFFDDDKEKPNTYLSNIWKANRNGKRKEESTWLSENWPKLPYYRPGSFQHIDPVKWDALVGGEVGSELEDPLVCIWDECEQALYQETMIQGGHWSKAKAIYLDQGIVSKSFMNYVVGIRLLWQKTRFNFVLGMGNTNWKRLAPKLDQYLEMKEGWKEITIESTYHEKKRMMLFLFGEPVT